MNPTTRRPPWSTKLGRRTISLDDADMRTIVDIPEEQIKALDEYRRKKCISRAEAVRRAVAAFLPPKRSKKFDFRNHPAFGSWKDRGIDSVDYIRKLRDEWEDAP